MGKLEKISPEYINSYNDARVTFLEGLALCSAIDKLASENTGMFDKLNWLNRNNISHEAIMDKENFPFLGLAAPMCSDPKESFFFEFGAEKAIQHLAQIKNIIESRVKTLKTISRTLKLNPEDIIQKSYEKRNVEQERIS